MSADGVLKPQCVAVVDRINEYIDGEVTAAELAAVREHLLDCPPCLEEHDVQVALKALVRRCLSTERAPEGLRVRILTQITATQVTTTGFTEVRVLHD